MMLSSHIKVYFKVELYDVYYRIYLEVYSKVVESVDSGVRQSSVSVLALPFTVTC